MPGKSAVGVGSALAASSQSPRREWLIWADGLLERGSAQETAG